jgi:hypothetical protein
MVLPAAILTRHLSICTVQPCTVCHVGTILNLCKCYIDCHFICLSYHRPFVPFKQNKLPCVNTNVTKYVNNASFHVYSSVMLDLTTPLMQVPGHCYTSVHLCHIFFNSLQNHYATHVVGPESCHAQISCHAEERIYMEVHTKRLDRSSHIIFTTHSALYCHDCLYVGPCRA